MRLGGIAAVLMMLSCGGGSIVGTWTSGSDIIDTFNADGTFTTHSVKTDPKSQCTTTDDEKATWSTSGNNLTITPTADTQAIANCTDPTMNAAAHPVDPSTLQVVMLTYSVSGNTLTLTYDGFPFVFMRQ